MVPHTKKEKLFLLLFAIICLPLLQHCFTFLNPAPLNGAVTNAEDIDFTPDKWWQGDYQRQKEKYLNDHMGMRPYIVRMNNQLDYWLYKKLHVDDVVLGKNNYLYEKRYIESYCGRSYSGGELIHDRITKLRMLQDTFRKMGKHLVVVYAPSKAHYYPEYIPDSLRCDGMNMLTDYKEFIRLSDSMAINYIDFNAWFVSMKRSSKHLLFSKPGIHWTKYGALLAADSLIKYIEHVQGVDMPSLTLSNIRQTYDAEKGDKDIENALNLVYPLSNEKFTYADYNYDEDSSKTKPTGIFIGDSFVWGLLGVNMPQSTSKYWEYWYYYRDIFDKDVMAGKKQAANTDNFDWVAPVDRADYVILIYTEVNLNNIGNSFLHIATDYYYPKRKN